LSVDVTEDELRTHFSKYDLLVPPRYAASVSCPMLYVIARITRCTAHVACATGMAP
jgi:hypothetical protein